MLKAILNFLTFGWYGRRWLENNREKQQEIVKERYANLFGINSVRVITTVNYYTKDYRSTVYVDDLPNKITFHITEARNEDDEILLAAYNKAKNLAERFKDVITTFNIEVYEDKDKKTSCKYWVCYMLGDETKAFACDYRSNMLKKKLVGAQNHIAKAVDKLMSFIGNLNIFYANFHSRLFASIEFFDSPYNAKHFRVCLNEMVLIDTREFKESPVSSYFLFSSEENETTLKSLVSRDLVKVSIDNKIYLCDAKVKCKDKLIACRPIVANRGQVIVTTTAILLGSYKGVNSTKD